jgi:hypothetical protein
MGLLVRGLIVLVHFSGAHYFKIETAQGDINLHPKSVLCNLPLKYDYLVYYQKMHTSKVGSSYILW